jgi:hypothetical protein
VSMNESCWLQAKFARQQLAERFGSAEIQFVDSAGTDLLCDIDIFGGSAFEAGTALIAVGADRVWDPALLILQRRRPLSSGQTERAAACMLVSFETSMGQIVRACSAHLNPDDATAQRQAQTLVQALRGDVYRLYAVKRGSRPLIGVAVGVCQSTPQCRRRRSR